MAIELPVEYYLDNFTTVLDHVDDLYADILGREERDFSKAFRGCTTDAQKLYVRLVSRKGPHFRADKLQYAEIGNLNAAARELAKTDLLAIDGYPETEALPLLARAEVLALIGRFKDQCDGLPGRAGSRKGDLLQWVTEHLDEEAIRAEIEALAPIYTPLCGETLLIYRLLFFGNLRQDLTEFVLQDLGLLRYEAYPLSREDRLFSTRRLVLHTLAYARLSELAWAAVEANEIDLFGDIYAAMPDTLGENSLEARRGKIINRMARQLERAQATERALAMYAGTDRPPARERRVRILERAARYEEALTLARAMELEARDLTESEFTRRFIPKLEKKLGRPATVPKRIRHPETWLCLARREDRRIEAVVLDHYETLGREGFYAENRFFQGLFGLAFWDIVFAPIRGAFFNRFQRGPAGMFSSRFYEDRRDLIDERLRRVRQEADWPDDMLATYQRKEGIANYLVHWRYVPMERIDAALKLMDRRHLAAIFERMARDPGSWRTGFPDLFLHTEDGGYELVEVKGPGDQLQNNQRRWLRFFKETGIPYRLARVTWDETV